MGILETFRGEHCNRKNVNVAVASYVTTQARLQLYDYLRELCESVFYCDTDSVIYIQNVNEPTSVKTGEYLGDLKASWNSMAQARTSEIFSRVTLNVMRFQSSAPPQENRQRNVK